MYTFIVALRAPEFIIFDMQITIINITSTMKLNHFLLYFIVFSTIVFTPHAGPSAAYGPEAMGYMMDSQAHMNMMQRPPGDPGFHQGYAHYPPAEYYGHHL